MTACVVNIDLRTPTEDGDEPAVGSVQFRPTKRLDLEGAIVLPDPFEVTLVNGQASVSLTPTTDGDWAWRIVEKIKGGRWWYAIVPDGPGPVDYDDLEEVDKTTLDPTAPIVPVWKAYIDAGDADLQAQIDGMQASDVESVAGLIGEVTTPQLKTALSLPTDTAGDLDSIDGRVTTIEGDYITATDLTTQIDAAKSELLGGAPAAALDTLAELGDALGDDANFAATMTTALAGKVPTTRTVNGHALTGDVTLAKADVGLGNASNTSDADKPVSTATAAAITAEATARDAAILARKRVQPNTVAILGASIANMAGGSGVGTYDTPVASPFTRADGYFPWANISLGGRLTLVKNAGVSGERSDQILARVTDVTNLATLPGFCILSDAASNDLLQSVASATIITNLAAICDALQAKGITVVICTVLPLAGNAAHLLRQEEVNTWIRDRAGQPGFIVCDWAARWADATSTGPKTGYSTDGTHPTALGAGNIGKVLADAMRPHIAGSILLPSHNLDGLSSNPNPLMVGTAGTASTGTTGSVADNWITLRGSGAGSMAAAKVARADGIGGAWQLLTISGGGGQFFLYSDVANGAVAGQKWQAEMEFEAADFSGITNFRPVVQSLGVGTESGYGLYQVSPAALTLDITSGVVRTPVFTVPAVATATLRTMLVFQGTAGSVRIGRFRTRRVA